MSLRPIPNVKDERDLGLFHNDIRKILDPGKDQTLVVNGKTLTFKNGVLTNID